MMSVFNTLIGLNDSLAALGIDNQVRDANSRYFGGVVDPGSGIAWPNHTNGTPAVMGYWAAAIVNPASRYYRDADVLHSLAIAADYMLRMQHEDGTISPGWTNYHSPPDTGFVIVCYAQALLLLEDSNWQPLEDVIAAMRLFLERTIPAMLTGGIHTPNHRWVLCASLGFLKEIFGLQEAGQRAEEWLAEGLDCTPDGEWTERSNGIYNAVSDIMLIHAARLLGKPELLDQVRRNLRMMVYLVHPTGEVVTDYSGRQDFGHMHTLAGYFIAYRMMAVLDKDPVFEAMAELAGESLVHHNELPNNALLTLLLEPAFREASVKPAELPTHYRKVLGNEFPRKTYLAAMDAAGHGGQIKHSRLHPDFGAPVARIRSGATSATIMTETPSFFALRHGKARLLGVQIGSSFEPGVIPMSELTAAPDGWELSAVQEKGYNGPVPKPLLPVSASETVSPWYLLPHQHRPATHTKAMPVRVEATELADGWKLRIIAEEPADVVTQIALVFGDEGRFASGTLKAVDAHASFWLDGTVRYENGDDWIEVTGAAHEHWSQSIRNAAYPTGCKTLLINVMTPYDHTITIRLS
ncbi:hypothetical protein [Paenibacillus sp. R14(2021)]|uniref:hypothetical protein n=1 Tax=Paenibacillus sp. R14(2021) TaxID=2859228 RepID=UPI001C615548|nr:hypothetical protein [Paenibacillus sp. R14(2021)]